MQMAQPFVHHVFFWLKDPSSEADRIALQNGLRTLTAIRSISSYHIGVPAGTDREVIDTSYDFSWLALFTDREAQDAYQIDPVHIAFVRQCSHLWGRVQVYDSLPERLL
jgi:hypothetical protein